MPLIVPQDQLAPALMAAGCRQVILVPDDRTNANPNDLIDQLVGADIAVAIVPSLRRLPLYGLSTNYFFGKDLLLLQVRNNLARLPQRIIKRSLDLIGAVFLAVVLAPRIPAVRLPDLERGWRAGVLPPDAGGPWRARFRLLEIPHHGGGCGSPARALGNGKSRSCWRSYCESNFKLQTDPRVTRIGAWMRRKSLDELPQLLNVLMGDMSLVGPRPLLRRELPDYGAVISLYERVRPGITGLWQISGRSHTTFAERVSYDEWYIKNWTVWYDMVIVLQTLWVLVRGKARINRTRLGRLKSDNDVPEE